MVRSSEYLPQRALLLCRISDARDGETVGVDDQEKRLRALAGHLGWALGPAATHVIIENDTSAYKRKRIRLPDGRTELRTVRPKFRRIPGIESQQTPVLELLATGRADGMIAYDLDRAVRDPRDLEDLIDVVEERHIPVTSVTGSLRLANDADITMARVMVAVANKSSRDTARRVSTARLRMAEAGEPGGGIRRFGRESDGITPRSVTCPGCGPGGTFTVQAAETDSGISYAKCVCGRCGGDAAVAEGSEVDTLRTIAAKILNNVSLQESVATLRRGGVPTVTGVDWRAKVVRGILLRESNWGAAVHKGEVVREDAFPPLLDDDPARARAMHLALVRILTDPSRCTTPGPAPRWLGSGIYRCGRCLPRVVGLRAQHNGRGLRGYGCPECGLVRSGRHLDAYIANTDLDQGPYGVLIQRLMRDDATELLAEPRPAADQQQLHAQAAEVEARLRENQEDYDSGLKTRRQYLDSNARNLKRLREIEEQIAEAGADREHSPLALLVKSDDPAAVWEGLDLSVQRAVLREVAVVTVLPSPRGRKPGGGYFDPGSVRVEPAGQES
ncbi:recombinase family protein [Streptomyces blattellae]|uniref:recombinase family protein n=1 Tax=Streptomyces blattellae TaxID=2569855 RepID=UPI0012B98635|nr:recombinase family protein [Streptomyces blattellae]